MFKIESHLASNKSSNSIDHHHHHHHSLHHQQMESVSSKLRNELDRTSSNKSQTEHYKSTDEDLSNDGLVEDDFNQQRVGSTEFTSQSSSDESNESSSSDDSRSEDEEPALSHSFRQINQRGSASINRSFKPKNKEDLFLKSLEVDRFAPKKLFGKFKLIE